MTIDQAKKLTVVFRQMREAVKDAVDNIEAIAEQAVMIFVDEETSGKALQSSANNENRLLNKKELAERLGVSVRTISELQTEGLPTVKFGKSVRFDYQDVLIWAKNRKLPKSRKNSLRMVA